MEGNKLNISERKTKYIVKVEYEDGNVWVLIRTWDDQDYKAFWEKEKTHQPSIKSLTVFPIEDFDKDNNTGRWWNVANVKKGE